jgi:prepilin-type N-terminal cleavage/methylation domain-containing protein
MPRLGGRPAAAPFTLIEIMVTLVILGFALVLITGYRPLWSSALSLQDTAAELASGLRLARSQDNRPAVFAVDVAAHWPSASIG